MSKQNKWAGSSGKVGASGGSKVNGSNVYSSPEASPAPKAAVGQGQNVIKMPFSPGDNFGTQKISTHNDINAFTRGIKSRGPYGGPSFKSLNHYEKMAQSSNTSAISAEMKGPSGAGSKQRGTVGGSGSGATTTPKSQGSSKVKGTTQSSPKGSNKDGSGYMASVR